MKKVYERSYSPRLKLRKFVEKKKEFLDEADFLRVFSEGNGQNQNQCENKRSFALPEV